MSEKNKYGYCHMANEEEYVRWYNLVKEVYNQLNYKTRIILIITKNIN